MLVEPGSFSALLKSLKKLKKFNVHAATLLP